MTSFSEAPCHGDDVLAKMKLGYSPFPDPEHLNNAQIAFFTLMYGYMLFGAANLISDGSELLLLVPSVAGLVGSIVLPILGAVPDGMMVLFSGLGDREAAQDKVAVGVGALCGSTVMLLTLPWFLAVFTGRVNIKNGQYTYKAPANAGPSWEKLSPPGNCSLFQTGISFLPELKKNAWLMLLTSVSYFIIQIPAFMKDTKKPKDMDPVLRRQLIDAEADAEKSYVLAAMVVCFVLFCFYLFVMWKDSQSTDSEHANKVARKTVQSIKDGQLTLRGAMAHFRDTGGLVGELDVQADLETLLLNKRSVDDVRRMCKLLEPFFSYYDRYGNGTIDFEEFRMVFRDVHANLSAEGQRAMFRAADTDMSGAISFEEFVACMMSYALDTSVDLKEDVTPPGNSKGDDDGGDDDDDDGEGDEGEEQEEIPEDLADLDPAAQQRRIKIRSIWMMSLGTFLVMLFSDPMVDLLAEIGVRTRISAFYISFVIAPVASNASELVAALNYAKKKTTTSMNTALSCLLGAGIMNNTFCTGIFLGLIYFQRLAWEFKAETASILAIEFLMGMTVIVRRGQKTADCFLVLSYYPMALGIVLFLENVMDWD